jgi:hypothetical protein
MAGMPALFLLAFFSSTGGKLAWYCEKARGESRPLLARIASSSVGGGNEGAFPFGVLGGDGWETFRTAMLISSSGARYFDMS